ncbi:MAG: PAS domain-containing protein [Firmicutes bacterium]|nr:PAS domain-containing protein [Bacillota bacterium]
MEQKLIRFFAKNKIKPTDIMYVFRSERKTHIHLKNNTVLDTYIPMKWLLAALPDGAYLHINKGVILASDFVEKIEGACYTMKDGRSFTGRVRTAGIHKQNRQVLEHVDLHAGETITHSIYQQFSVMDNLPVPFCVVELLINSDEHDIDFIFRYCNEAMARLGGVSRESLIDLPCQDAFVRPDRKWILAFTETALSGTTARIDDIYPQTGKKVRVHCFQPAKNLCACMMIELDN